ncbi:MAG: asparaginase [Alphaproteobacteria bacterium]
MAIEDAFGKPGDDPIVVAITRGKLVESHHLVDLAVVDADGGLVGGWGAVDHPVYPRSACKPLQALPLVESGAADAFGLEAKHLALACASHAGEPVHVDTVLAWLEKIGLSDDNLECGAHYPRNEAVFRALVKSGDELRQAHSNCSGKHTGMLTTAIHLGEPTAGYIRADHPVQRRIRAVLGELCGADLEDAEHGIDGCGIPTIPINLRALALGITRLATPTTLAPARAAACNRITSAMLAEPYMVAGRDRACTAIMRAAAGDAIAKTGAEGVYMAALPGRGIGLALKARDGAGRAAEVACVTALRHLGGLPETVADNAVAAILDTRLHNVVGLPVGDMHAQGWADRAGF